MKTLAHEFLDIEKKDFEVSQSCYGSLNEILEKARENINVLSKPEEILLSIAQIIKELGLSYEENILFNEAFLREKMNCSVCSILYHSIGEVLELPLSIASAPGHVFVRWDGEYKFNWETMDGTKRDNEWYVSFFNIHDKSIKNGVYLQKLTRDEVKSSGFNNCGRVNLEKGNLEGAILDYNKAIELNPNFASGYANRGNVWFDKEDYERAILDYNKAIELDPNLAAAYNNRGNARSGKEDHEGAILDYNKAIKLNPEKKEVINPLIEREERILNLKKAHKLLSKGLEAGNEEVLKNKYIDSLAIYADCTRDEIITALESTEKSNPPKN